MSLRTKLTLGLAFLFFIIFSLAMYSSYNIQRLSKDADAIIKDNYDSLVYCKNMLLALDDMRTAVGNSVIAKQPEQASSYNTQLFETGKMAFESNLAKERSNITEIHEVDYVRQLARDYELFLNLGRRINRDGESPSLYLKDFLSAYFNARQTVSRINDLNMEAVQRKNNSAASDAKRMIISIAAVGAACIIVALLYFWYFPFFVSNSLSFLAGRMNELLKSLGIRIETQTKDEAFILLSSINLLENKLVTHAEKGKRRSK
jgi:CHASE3 domain sensor protein